MIWTRTPCRLSFLGGGTDLPAFFEKDEGCVLSATINRYIYVGVKPAHDRLHHLRHEGLEVAEKIDDIKNPIVREVLKAYPALRDDKGAELGWDITSISDVPAGTGLGSSSSFTVGLVHAVRRQLGLETNAVKLAEEAVETEVFRLASAAGKQDQYCAALGGFLFMRFLPSGEVTAERLQVSATTMEALSASTVMFYTGITRSASDVLARRREGTAQKRHELLEMVQLAGRLKALLEGGHPMEDVGKLMHEGWQLKRGLAYGITSHQIDEWYARGLGAGAWGGKLMGAGGGGYLLFVVPPERRANVIRELSDLKPVPFAFEPNGTSSISW